MASHIDSYASIACMPEDLTLLLFNMVLENGRLNPKVLKVFKQSGHELVDKRIKELNIKEPPPLLVESRNRWLHQKSGLY